MKPQRIAFAWAMKTYGSVVRSTRYQAFRFIEEALELAQAMGLSREDVIRVVDHVFSRPQGDTYVGVGDVRLTLDILAETQEIDSDECYEGCMIRVLALDPAKMREKDKMKIEKGLY